MSLAGYFSLLLIVVVAGDPCNRITQRVQCKALTCNAASGLCVPCSSDAECYDGGYACYNGRCEWMSLANSFSARTLLAPLVGFVVCAVAVLAGVGGGAILVTAFVVILQIPLKDAVGLSQATICGQAILNVAFQAVSHHPDHAPPKPTRPIINYEYCNLLLPMALSGTILGSLGSKVSPNWLRIVLLLVLFSYMLYRLILRVIAERNAAATDEERTDSSEELSPYVEKAPEKPQFPIFWISWTVFVLGVYFLLSLSITQFVNCGTTEYFLIVIVSVMIGLGLTVVVRLHLLGLKERVDSGELPDAAVPFAWNPLTTIVFPVICIVAGFAASMLGIGGGLVFSALLLEAGLAPRHASATGGLATLIVAVQAATNFALAGHLRFDFALLMFSSGIASAVVGKFVLMPQIVRRGATYLVVAALALIMGGSMISVVAYGVANTVLIVENGGSLGFGPLCPIDPAM